MATLQFIGATGTVTGSKYLLTVGNNHILIDCGLYQGPRKLRERNHLPLPIPTPRIDAVVLTHAHLDHSGFVPRLVADGFHGPVFCTHGTADLLGILLPDSAHLLSEEASYKSKYRETPKQPLYTPADAEKALTLVKAVAYRAPFDIAEGIKGYYRQAGHILGAATLELRITEGDQETVLVASGDLGRSGMLVLPDPEPVPYADALLLESTYGDRLHDPHPADWQLAAIIDEAIADDSVLLIPAFAVGRTQELLATLRNLERGGRIPSLPIYVDSPMAIEATELLSAHVEDLSASARDLIRIGESPIGCSRLSLTRTVAESKELNDVNGPAIIISASGMANGGRIMHHLRARLNDPRTIVCLAGYQADGTLGRALLDGAGTVTIYGHQVEVRAKIRTLMALSAHADQAGLLKWCAGFQVKPKAFITHGDDAPRAALAGHLRTAGWDAVVPALGDLVTLPSHAPLPVWPYQGQTNGVVVSHPAASTPFLELDSQDVPPPTRLVIGVMGSATDDVSETARAKARRLGQVIAAEEAVLLTGACPGLPHDCVMAAKELGGMTIGISPALDRREHVLRYGSPVDGYDVMIYTGSGLMGREVTNIRSSDIVIIVGGRSGTLGEFAIAYDEGKLIGVLQGTGGLTEHIDTILRICDKETGARLIFDEDPERLMAALLEAYPAYYRTVRHPSGDNGAFAPAGQG
jgi:metallo-beta-lactamase family protein